jgi:hypothetical protein
LSQPPLSPKSRIRAVYTERDVPVSRTEQVIYQLEDTGHPRLRLRPVIRVEETGGGTEYIYRVEAYSRLTGAHLGYAEAIAAPGSSAEHAARTRQFQSAPFREAVDQLRQRLIDRFQDLEPTGAVQG